MSRSAARAVAAATDADRDGPAGVIRAYDVRIVGAGLAGQRAAVAAAETGVSVGAGSKVHPVALALDRGGGRDQRRAQAR